MYNIWGTTGERWEGERSYGKYIEVGAWGVCMGIPAKQGTAGKPGLYYGHSTNLSKESHKESIMF